MNRAGKNIRMVLILLAGLVILLHSIVTHHHHSDLFGDNFSSVLNTNKIPGESSDEANKHCHAFNNIKLQFVFCFGFWHRTSQYQGRTNHFFYPKYCSTQTIFFY